MPKEVIHKDDNLLLEYVAKGNYLHETWWGITPSFKFTKLLDIIINTLEEKQADGLLLDATKHLGLKQEDRDLAAQKHEDYAVKHGKLKQAIIVPKEDFSAYSVKSYSDKFDIKSISEIRFFKDIPSAEEWLQGK